MENILRIFVYDEGGLKKMEWRRWLSFGLESKTKINRFVANLENIPSLKKILNGGLNSNSTSSRGFSIGEGRDWRKEKLSKISRF